jgi:hypothetical protein
MKRIAVISLAIMICFPAIAQTPDAGWPRELRMVVEDARKECIAADGKEITLPKTFLRKADLNGDGRADYIVDFSDVVCDAAQSLYCGTGGCNLEIFVAQSDGALKSIFSGRALNYKIQPGAGTKRIRFQLHGSYCGKSGGTLCTKTHLVDGRPFEFKEPR